MLGGTSTITPKRSSASARAETDPGKAAEPTWNPVDHPLSWRAVWAYSRKRAVCDSKTLTIQQQRAQSVIDGDRAPKKSRFVKTTDGEVSLDQAGLERARRLVGLKQITVRIAGHDVLSGDQLTPAAAQILGALQADSK